MAVYCGLFSVIARNASLDECFLGGVRAFQEICPNLTFCTDGHICRLGFMALDDARGFVSWVTQSGLVKDGYKLDLVIVSPAVGILPAPDWLRFGNIQGYTAAWLEEKEPGNLFISQGDLELHSSPKPVLLSAHELQESYDFVGTKNSVEEYATRKPGNQPMWVGPDTRIKKEPCSHLTWNNRRATHESCIPQNRGGGSSGNDLAPHETALEFTFPASSCQPSCARSWVCPFA